METSSASPVAGLGRRAKAASRVLATASTAAKDEALRAAADLLEQRSGDVLAANAADVEAAAAAGMEAGPLDRLRLSEARLAGMAAGLRKVAALPDPIGEVLDGWKRPNGLEISRVRVPLGVVAIIYENRPNVTSDAGGLCLKSGNAALLRGSSTALRSNQAVTALLREGAAKAGLPEDSVLLVEDVSHEAAVELMQLTGYVDCLIPRGGPSLVRSILDNAKVPYVIDGDGNCHVYVDAAAALGNAGVELVGDEAARRLVPSMGEATEDDFGREFLALKMSVAVVPDLEAAVAHVNRYGTGHTEAIVTDDVAAARRFVGAVDAGTVTVNASTRFTDGEEFGFGAEIGISTQKLHARGPMALPELTSTKYVVTGEGHLKGA